MIDTDVLLGQIPGLDPRDLDRWISNAWVRPAGPNEGRLFREIDVARVRLIVELRDDMQVNEEALPIVLHLLDQLHDTRRRMRDVADALAQIAPEDVRRRMMRLLAANIN
jgi:chaperone modulatory protein CbpM